jgi:mevalonate kinase
VNLPARGRAAGKVILLGEHAVVYGRPALAAGLDLGLDVELDTGRPPDDARLTRLLADAAAALGVRAAGIHVAVRSDLPQGAGLGSSAALCVAVLRALAVAAGRVLTPADELGLGRRLEAIFHGHPSGIDPAAAALGRTCFRFVRGEPPTVTPLAVARLLPLVVALGAQRSTGAAVQGLRARWEAEPARYERLFDDVAAVVDAGARAAERGDLPALGQAFDRNQELLATLGVSAPASEVLVATARRAGALGAKLTGGGAGGAVIALAPDTARVAAALGEQGVETIITHVGAAAEVAA